MNPVRGFLVTTTLGGVLALSSAGMASAAVTLASGTLKDAAGAPAAGVAQVWNVPRKASQKPTLIGQATSDAAGLYVVTATDESKLPALAAANGGKTIDILVSANVPGLTGATNRSIVVTSTDGVVSVAEPEAASGGVGELRSAATQDAPAAPAVTPEPIDVQAMQPVRPPATPRSTSTRAPVCENKVEQKKPVVTRKLAIVGEVANAYNDGTVATFAYSRGGGASTSFSIAQGYETKGGKIGFSYGGSNYIDDRGKVKFPPATRRVARKLRTQFEFTKRAARTNTCAAFYTEVRATSFIGGVNASIKNPQALDKCDPSKLEAYPPKSGFEREQGKGSENTVGAEAFGASLSSTTNFSKSAALAVEYGGKGGAKHYACGPDGAQSPFEARSVYSGAKR